MPEKYACNENKERQKPQKFQTQISRDAEIRDYSSWWQCYKAWKVGAVVFCILWLYI